MAQTQSAKIVLGWDLNQFSLDQLISSQLNFGRQYSSYRGVEDTSGAPGDGH